MANTIRLLVNDYICGDFFPSRQLEFFVSESCLEEYLRITKDDRTIAEFMDTCCSDETSDVYEFATDGGMILSESISYCDDFLSAYNNYVDTVKNPASVEDFYWEIYVWSNIG